MAHPKPGPGGGSTCTLQSPQPQLQDWVDVMLLSGRDSPVTSHVPLKVACSVLVMTAGRTAKPCVQEALNAPSLPESDFTDMAHTDQGTLIPIKAPVTSSSPSNSLALLDAGLSHPRASESCIRE